MTRRRLFAMLIGLSAIAACTSPLAPTASTPTQTVILPSLAPTLPVFTPALPPGRPRVILDCPDGTIPVLYESSPACQIADEDDSDIWLQ